MPFCTVLNGSDWSVRSPLAPLDWFDDSIDTFIDAYIAASQGDVGKALTLLSDIRNSDLQEWMHVHAQNAGYWRANGKRPSAPTRHPRKVSADLEKQLFVRDGYRCRYCSIRVFPSEILRKSSQFFGDEVFPIKGGNLQRHGIKLCFSATLDHVEPLSLGGSNDASNLVTACWCCNYGKSAYSLTELGIVDPRGFLPVVSDWQGLTDC